MIQKCKITGCQNEATVDITYAHEDKDLRWSSEMCSSCAKEAFDKKGTGEFIFRPIKQKPVCNTK